MIAVRRALGLSTIERSVVQDKKFLCTIVSYLTALVVFLNLKSLQSPLVGLTAFATYFVINAVFLGNAFFKEENAFFRLAFGALLFIMLLGLVGWVTLIVHNLDILRVILVLLVTATLSSLLNMRMRHRNARK